MSRQHIAPARCSSLTIGGFTGHMAQGSARVQRGPAAESLYHARRHVVLYVKSLAYNPCGPTLPRPCSHFTSLARRRVKTGACRTIGPSISTLYRPSDIGPLLHSLIMYLSISRLTSEQCYSNFYDFPHSMDQTIVPMLTCMMIRATSCMGDIFVLATLSGDHGVRCASEICICFPACRPGGAMA